MHIELQEASSGVSAPVLGSCGAGHTHVCVLLQYRDVGTPVWRPCMQRLHSGCLSGSVPDQGCPLHEEPLSSHQVLPWSECAPPVKGLGAGGISSLGQEVGRSAGDACLPGSVHGALRSCMLAT